MANKRVSELTTISAGDLQDDDLLLLADVSANESKQLQLGELSGYLLAGGILSGSFYGTASWARNSVTASYVGLQQTASYSLTSSYAISSVVSVPSQISCSWASASFSSSYALSSSYSKLTNADSASIADLAKQARTASYVYYTGINNGTVYHCIVADSTTFALNCNTAKTASYFDTSIGGVTIDSASYAISSSWTERALLSDVTSFAFNSVIAESSSYLKRENQYEVYSITASYISGSSLEISTGSAIPFDQANIKAWMPVTFDGKSYFIPLYQ